MVAGIVSLTIEMDIKAMLRHMHLLLSATLNKWANIMVAAAEGHTSPYALNQEEYLKIAEDIQKTTGI